MKISEPFLINEETQPVAQKEPNAWGFYDMSGNVYEWCSDQEDHETYRSMLASFDSDASASVPPVYIKRGSCWNDSHTYCRVVYHSWNHADIRWNNIGGRLVRRHLD